MTALWRIPVFLRVRGHDQGGDGADNFVLYRSKNVRFIEADRARLLEGETKFVYVPMADHNRFRMQLENQLSEAVTDPKLARAEAAALVYETSLELVNEVLSEPNLAKQIPRLQRVARAVTTLTLRDAGAFSDLFATAHHDFYTATHTVNVATWMVSLAYAMGHDDPQTLSNFCQAGMLHDVGKIYLPPDLLNKRGALSADDRKKILLHPRLGRRHLEQHRNLDPLILRVADEHHERLDGSGYPNGLTADEIHEASKICAVVDSFDAMTAFRPYKKRTMTVAAAMETLQSETPAKYDPQVMKAWCSLMTSVGDVQLPCEQTDDALAAEPMPTDQASCRRLYPRHPFHCAARVEVVEVQAEGITTEPPVEATAHNISRSGLALLSVVPVDVGRTVRVFLAARGLKRDWIEGRVIRCHAYSDGCFDVGVYIAGLCDN